MRKYLSFLFLFFITLYSYSQEIYWENLKSENNQTVFKTDIELLNKKLINTKNSSNTTIKFPIDDFNLKEFNLNLDSDSKKYGNSNIQLFKGNSINKEDKVFVNIIGEIITITIIQTNKRLHLSNIKNKNKFTLKEIDTSNEFDNINLENDIINHSEHSSEKKKLFN